MRNVASKPQIATAVLLLVGCLASGCLAPSTRQGPCLFPLEEYVGRGRHGHPIYRTYGWSRDGAYKESLEAALADRPDVLLQLQRAQAENQTGLWLVGSGVLGVIVGIGVTTLAVTRFAHAGEPSEPARTVGLGGFGVGLGVSAIGAALSFDGASRFARGLARFNATGCETR